MPTAVFLSSTGEDLESDCRPYAIRAIQRGGGVEVAMETWDSEFQNALEVCRRKVVEDSTHYVGVIAFRRGWVPQGSDSSVTEMEFQWALDEGHPMAILVPDASTLFGKELLRRALVSGQSERDSKAQEAFRARIRSLGTHMRFEDPGDLTTKVMRRVLSWSSGGIMSIADAGGGQRSAELPRPDRSDLRSLGRKVQVRAWQDALDLPFSGSLVHGAAGAGHDSLVDRLVEEAENVMPAGARTVRVAVGPWADRSAEGLRERTGASLGIADAREVGVLEQGLLDILTTQGVVLLFSGLQRLDGGLAAFLDGFWTPVAQALGEGAPHRLAVVAALESADTPSLVTELQEAHTADPMDPSRFVVLDRLGSVTESELTSWLRRWLPADLARTVAEDLLTETGGAIAPLFHKLIYDDAIWP